MSNEEFPVVFVILIDGLPAVEGTRRRRVFRITFAIDEYRYDEMKYKLLLRFFFSVERKRVLEKKGCRMCSTRSHRIRKKKETLT